MKSAIPDRSGPMPNTPYKPHKLPKVTKKQAPKMPIIVPAMYEPTPTKKATPKYLAIEGICFEGKRLRQCT